MTDEAKTMEISRADCLELLIAIGWNNAAKWDNDRLEEKLPQVKDVVPSTPLAEEKLAKLLIDVLAATEAGCKFKVVGEAAPGTGGKTTKAKPELTAEQIEAKKAEAAAKKAEKEKAKADKKAAADAAKAAAKAAKESGPKSIRPSTTNPWIAGQILKKYGLGVGITKEMLDEFDAVRGKSNPVEARFVLANSWHAINGYTEQIARQDPPKKEAVAADTAPAAEPAPAAETSEKPAEEVVVSA
jgi:hypothetical protein